MAGGLIAAGIAGGVGQGLNTVSNAFGQMAQVYGAQMLSRDRQAAEERRLAIMEKYAGEREQRGYAHQEALHAADREFQSGLNQQKIGADIVTRSQDREFQSTEKGLDRAEQARERDQTAAVAREGHAATASHYKAVEAHNTALEKIYSEKNANDAKEVKSFITDKDGRYLALMKDGTTNPVIDPITNKPIESQKQLTDAAKALADLHQKQGDAAMKSSAESLLPDEERKALRQQANNSYARAASYLGEQPTEKPKGPDFAADDPWRGTAKGSAVAKPPPPNRAVEADAFLATKREEAAQRAGTKREQTQQDALAAMETEKPGMVQSTSPLREGPPAPMTSRQSEGTLLGGLKRRWDEGFPATASKQELPRANAPAVASTPLPGMERQKLAMEQPKGVGMVALGQLGTEQAGATKEGRPIIKNPDGSISTERTITVTDPRLNGGKPTNIPSMYGGKEVSEDEAIQRIVKAGGKDPETGQAMQSFDTIDAAVSAARSRSTSLGSEYGQPEPNTKEPMADVQTPAKGTPYEAEIQAAAAKYGVNPNLVRAIVKQESNFNPSATSKAGAQGLMQLMPATAKEQGATDPLDPAQNIEAGTKYLSYLLKKYNGDEEQALAAYNFGLGNVDKGLKWPSETQRYVSAVRKGAEVESGPTVKTAVASASTPGPMELIDKLPAQTRTYVRGEISDALNALQAGQITEEQFTGRILAAWTAVPGSPTEYANSAREVAKGLIAEAKGTR